MLTRRVVAAPLISKPSFASRTQPAPLDGLAPRPRVLTSPAHEPRQLSLFTRPGALR